MRIKRDGILLNSKNQNMPDMEYAPDDLVEKISMQIEEEYDEALRLLAKGPSNDNE